MDMYRCGYDHGVIEYKEKLLQAAEDGTPIELDERAYFLKSDIQNLRDTFSDLEQEAKEEPARCSFGVLKQNFFDCAADLMLTDKPREEVADNILKYLAELDKYKIVEEKQIIETSKIEDTMKEDYELDVDGTYKVDEPRRACRVSSEFINPDRIYYYKRSPIDDEQVWIYETPVSERFILGCHISKVTDLEKERVQRCVFRQDDKCGKSASCKVCSQNIEGRE